MNAPQSRIATLIAHLKTLRAEGRRADLPPMALAVVQRELESFLGSRADEILAALDSAPKLTKPAVIRAKPEEFERETLLVLQRVTGVVAEAFGVDESCLFAKARPNWMCAARFAAWRLARKYTRASFVSLGTFFRKDHTAILNGLKSAQSALDTDPIWQKKYERAEEALQDWLNQNMAEQIYSAVTD